MLASVSSAVRARSAALLVSQRRLEACRTFASAALPPHYKIPMPALSPTMTQGNIARWAKKVGDKVSPGDVLAEIETDKAVMEFEAGEEGYLAAILVPEGAKDVTIGTLLCVLSERQEDVDALKQVKDFSAESKPKKAPLSSSPMAESQAAKPSQSAPQSSSSSSSTPSNASTATTERIAASPLAKSIAAQKGVDLASISGSGPHGRIVKADVESASKLSAPTSLAAPSPRASTLPAAASAASTYTDIPHSNVRKVIAQRLSAAKQSIPHYYLTVDIRADAVLKLREQLNAMSNGQYKLSINDFIIKAAAMALRKVPAVNSSWMDTAIRQYHTVDISVAVSSETGLTTPIVRNADQKGLASISNTVRDLAAKVRDGKIQPHEYQGGTFTISNLGMLGVKQFTAVINPPQSCILAVGAIEKRVVPDSANAGGSPFAQVAVVDYMTVTMSCDHRVVDGAVGAQWLQAFKEYMEKPMTLML